MILKILRKISIHIDKLIEIFGKVASWFTSLLVVLICYDVLMRYVFNQSSAKVSELEWYAFSLIFLLGAGYAFKHDRHVRVDVFYSNFSKKVKAFVDLAGTLLFLIPFCVIVIVLSIKFALNSYNIQETSPDPGGWPFLFIIKSAIPVGFFLLLMQAISVLCKNILIMAVKKINFYCHD
ncbi:MAG: TRAP transporter small permease subunit [Bacteroidota bacterium]|nr:TRAP transporter small permease subunit [Bacteroidota bacterium]